MNDSIKVGIIIPAYNVESYIFRAMNSCIQQTYANIEIVVVDDGSPDGTYDVVQSYANKDARIKLYHQSNAGVSSARNHALDMCTADFVLFLDSDDWLEPDAVEKLIQVIQDPQAKALISAGCYYAYFDETSDIYKIIPDKTTTATAMSSKEALMYVGQRQYNLRSSCYKLYSLALINEHHIRFVPEIRHGEDGLFVFEYLKCADRFVYFPDPLWNILERPGSATQSPYNSSKLTAVAAVERMLTYENDEPLARELKQFLVHRTLATLGDALLSPSAPNADVKYLRKKLRGQFAAYLKAAKPMRAKLRYMAFAFAPKWLIRYLLKRRNKK